MADQTEERRDERLDDEPDRSTPGRGVSLAEEGGDDLPALLAIAVGIAVIVVLIWWSGTGTTDVETVAPEPAETTTTEAEAEPEPEETEEEEAAPEAAALDIAALTAAVGVAGIDLSADGGVVTARGEVADEAQRSEVLATLGAQPGVEEVIDELTIAVPAGTAVNVGVSQASIVLEGTVPSQEVADAFLAEAQAVYADDQIDNQLVVDDGSEPPITVTVTGSVTDPTLHSRVLSSFGDIEGVDSVDTSGFLLEESSEVEASLNNLEPIQFASGSSLIEPASEVILDEAAEFLLANPDLSIEIGGHTDSRGGDEANQQLSEARANAVREALVARGVTNEMQARGFGESRLKVDPDDTEEAQRENRRIEFRILN